MNDVITDVDPRGVATITLNRAERHNAFDDQTITSLTRELKIVGARDDVRVVVLESTGRSFSAGADLAWMRKMATYSDDENYTDALALANLMQTLDKLRHPTLAVVQGSAYGGGVGLIACCDIAIAADHSTFCLSEVRLGLTPATISPFVIRAIGSRQARRYFNTAETFSAQRAREIGLLHEVVPASDLSDKRDSVLGHLLSGAPGAQRDSKDLVFLCADNDHENLASETARRIAFRRTSSEGREGISAFLGKRMPSWRV